MKKTFTTLILIPIKQIIEKLLEIFFGNGNSYKVRVYRVKKSENLRNTNIPHSRIFPKATYSPWENDFAFNKVYEVAKEYTMVDEYRMYELFRLASQAAKLKGAFLEVGVWRGGSSVIIQAALDHVAANNKLYIADTFKGVVKAGSTKDTFYQGGEHADTNVDFVKNLFSEVQKKLPEILVGIFPDDHKVLDIDQLAFLHSDVDAYESTKGIIEWCLPKMVKGGIIVFDDYGFRGAEGVTEYVNEFLANKFVSENFHFIHNLNGHAILIKT